MGKTEQNNVSTSMVMPESLNASVKMEENVMHKENANPSTNATQTTPVKPSAKKLTA